MIAPLRGITMTETARLTAGGLFHPSEKNQKTFISSRISVEKCFPLR